MKKRIVAAFETWREGVETRKSSLYLSSLGNDVDGFIAGHYDSGTFATLHTFDCEDEAKEQYYK